MILLEVENNNIAYATCSRNKSLPSPYYLWTIRHKLSAETWRFIPTRIIPITVGYEPSYDAFEIATFSGSPEVFLGNVNLHLLEGEYYLKIYEQYSSTNLNPALSYDVVYEGMITVKSTLVPPPAYTGTSEVFIIYNE